MMKSLLVVGLLASFAVSMPAARADSAEGEKRRAERSELMQYLREADGEHLQQEEYLRIDVKGDAYLIRTMDLLPDKLWRGVKRYLGGGKDPEPAPSPSMTPAPEKPEFEISRDPPIDVERLTNKLREIIQSHPEITVTHGEEHVWSPAAERYLNFGFWERLFRFIKKDEQSHFPLPLLQRSKLFLLLSCGWTARYAITGHEDALEERLLTYEDRSVQIHDVLEESYVINSGDLYLTLLTAENVLAKNPFVDGRGNQPLQKKLAYIRNDSKPFGDNYGAWYHFMGIALYGFIRPGLVAHAVGEIENAGSRLMEDKDPQEHFMNQLGADFGKSAKRMFERRMYEIPLTPEDRTDYLLVGEPREESGSAE